MKTINGTSGNDNLFGTEDVDQMFGFDGNDKFRGSEGADTINGGNGTDTVSYRGYVETFLLRYPVIHPGFAVDVDLQRATQKGSHAEGDVLISIENVIGSLFEDIIKGNSGNNVLAGAFGDDILEGRDGNDVLSGDAENVADIGFVDLGPEDSGNDTLDGGAGNDDLFGDGGNDLLIGGTGNDELFGGQGDDTLNGGTGFNQLDGGTGFDTATYAQAGNAVHVFFANQNAADGVTFSINGNSVADSFTGVESIIGSSFDDLLEGSAAANTFDGGGGSDTILGFSGGDTLHGGGGDDFIDGGNGADAMDGGAGVDTVTYATANTNVNVSLGVVGSVNLPFIGTIPVMTTLGIGAGGFAEGDTLAFVENLIGSNFGDVLTGSNVANRLEGGGGDDLIDGGAGNDVIVGGTQTTFDTLSGGLGADTFLYLNRNEGVAFGQSPGDFILDFKVGQDKLDFSALGINANQLVILNQTVNGLNASTVVEDVNGNGIVDNGEFALGVRIDGAGFVTAQDILL